MASRAAGLDTIAFDDMHDWLRAARAHARVHELVANASSGQAAQPTDPSDTADGDRPTPTMGSSSMSHKWITDRIADLSELTGVNRRDLAELCNLQTHQRLPVIARHTPARLPAAERARVKTTGRIQAAAPLTK